MGKRLQTISKATIIIVGFAVLCVCILLFPELAREEIVAGKATLAETIPYLIGGWLLSVPIFGALYQAYKLVSYLSSKHAFSNKSVKALHSIKMCIVAFNMLVLAGSIIVIYVAKLSDPTEDVTPLLMLGLIFTFASSVVVMFIAILQRLLQEAIVMKSENDLTV